MDCSIPGFPALHYLPEFAQTHVHWVDDAIQPSHPLLSLLLLPSIFPSIWSFSVSWLFVSSDQSIGDSASVLPMNVQGWFPLGLTGLISLLSKGLPKVFSSTTAQKHHFHPSGSSQCTSPKHPVSCIKPGLATHFIHDIGWGGRREEGSGWGTHVYLWRIHFDIWQI